VLGRAGKVPLRRCQWYICYFIFIRHVRYDGSEEENNVRAENESEDGQGARRHVGSSWDAEECEKSIETGFLEQQGCSLNVVILNQARFC
jgi:hypothetical protein